MIILSSATCYNYAILWKKNPKNSQFFLQTQQMETLLKNWLICVENIRIYFIIRMTKANIVRLINYTSLTAQII